MATPSRFDLEQAATAFFKELTEELDKPRPFDPEHFDDDVRFNVECSRERTRELDDQLRSNIFDEAIRSKAAELTSSLPVQDLDQSMKLYALQLAARAEREQLALHIHLLTKPASRFVHHDQFFDPDDPREAPPPRPARAHPAETLFSSILPLSDATEEYQRKMALRGLGRSHVTETKRALDWLQERLGAGVDVDAITKRQLSVFRDDLSRLDIRLRGRTGSFKDRLTNDPQHQIKSVTAIRYWRSIQAFFDWCAAEHDLERNPAAGLKLQMRKGDARRSPEAFSQQELMQLFKTPLYNGYHSLKRVGRPGNCHVRNGQWWAGVLLMYTGLRAGELAQLLPSDFSLTAPVPHLRVSREDEAGVRTKTAKNAASVREVPLSPVLLQLGLAEFVAARAKGSTKLRIFREFRLGADGRASDGMTKFWAAYLRKFGLWKAGRSTHVWRHTVVGCLRANEVAEEDIAAFVGHSRGTATEGYGGSYPLSRKLKTADQLDYGFDVIAALSGPYDSKLHG